MAFSVGPWDRWDEVGSGQTGGTVGWGSRFVRCGVLAEMRPALLAVCAITRTGWLVAEHSEAPAGADASSGLARE